MLEMVTERCYPIVVECTICSESCYRYGRLHYILRHDIILNEGESVPFSVNP